uniref:Uncharacterized protein n=1 Tax=Syphacia muris TaxID=451379 RepID=A0A0N5AEJ3_9BILA
MQFGDSLFNMISEFTAMNRCPDYRWRPDFDSRISSADEHGDVAPINVQRRPFSDRRLSTVSGTTKSLPRLSWWKLRSKERRQSEPMIAPNDSLHERLEYLKKKHKQSLNSEEDEEDENKMWKNGNETTKSNVTTSNLANSSCSGYKKNQQHMKTTRQITRTDRGSMIVLDESPSSDADDEFTRL